MALKLGDLSKVPPKQKVFLTVLVCLIVGVAYYYLYYQSASREIGTLQSQLAELQSKIKEQEVIARNLPSFQAEVKRLEEQLALLLDQLPNFAEIPDLLKNVSDLGKESGLDFLKFSPGGEVGKGVSGESPMTPTMFHPFRIGLAVAVLVALMAGGCGKEESAPAPVVKKAVPKEDAKAAEAAQSAAAAGVKTPPVALYNPAGKRDPFLPFLKMEKREIRADLAALPPLMRYDLGELRD